MIPNNEYILLTMDSVSGTTVLNPRTGPDATLVNSASVQAGKDGNAVYAPSSSNAYLDLQIKALNEWTLCAWYKIDSFSNYTHLFTSKSGQGNFALKLLQNGTIYIYKSAYGSKQSWLSLSTGSWFFVCVRYDGKYLRIYLNGRVWGDIEYDASLPDGEYIIGTPPTKTSEGTPTSVDQLRLYDYALEEKHIKEIYNEFVGGPKSTTWTPSDGVHKPEAWLDASGLVDGTSVSAWNDQSGNGHDAAQGTTGNQPAVTTINGNTWVDFSGGKWMTTPNFFNNKNLSIIIVYRPNGTDERLIDNRGTAGFGTKAGVQIKHLGDGALTIDDGQGNWFGKNKTGVGSNGGLLGAFYKQSTFGIMRYDGGHNPNGLYNSATKPGPVVSNFDIYIGRDSRNDSTQQFHGQIAEILIYTEVLPLNEIQKIEGYLAHKWGYQDNLPWVHPYKAGPPQKPGGSSKSQVSGTVSVNGNPAARTVRAFSYNDVPQTIDSEDTIAAKSLGTAKSAADTGDYSIDLLDGYADPVFVVAFDDYGQVFTADASVAVGDRIHPTTPNGYVYECIGSGTLPSSEPTWTTDTNNAQQVGTASLMPTPFYRPMVHGPIKPTVT